MALLLVAVFLAYGLAGSVDYPDRVAALSPASTQEVTDGE